MFPPNTSLRSRIERAAYLGDRLEVTLWTQSESGTIAVVQPLTLNTLAEKETAYVPVPSFTMRVSEAQEFMDELWRAGLRPSEGTGSAGALAATQLHLEDMRAMTTKTLDAVLSFASKEASSLPKP